MTLKIKMVKINLRYEMRQFPWAHEREVDPSLPDDVSQVVQGLAQVVDGVADLHAVVEGVGHHDDVLAGDLGET